MMRIEKILFALTLVGMTPLAAHAVCGDGVIDAGEECDDGDTIAGSGCSETCQRMSAAWQCNGPPPGELINSSFEEDFGRSYIPNGWAIATVGEFPPRDEVDVIDVVTDATISDWVAQDGDRLLDLNGSDTSNLYQDIQTVPGEAYILQWHDSQSPTAVGGRGYTARLYDPTGGGGIYQAGVFQTVTVVDQPQPWRTQRLYFIAQSQLTRVQFYSNTSTGDEDGALIDNVAVFGACAAIPGCGNGITEANEGCDPNDPTYSGLGTCTENCFLRVGAECNRDIECVSQFCAISDVLGEPSICSFCGNFQIDEVGAEGCDLGNVNGTSGASCNDVCLINHGFACTEDDSCASGLCNDITGLCDTCGNGQLDPDEPCDFSIDQVGCTMTCLLTDGGQCQVNRECENNSCIRPVENLPGVCTLCGNGVLDPGEACDPLEDEGCNSSCLIQDGFECDADDVCASGYCAFVSEDDDFGRCVRCGNGVVERELGEECDGSAGCSSACTLTICGNGRLESGESCDDGNVSALDGCDTLCVVEPGYTCEVSDAGLGSVCRETLCGDGIIADAPRAVVGGIKCDDGNAENGDGCSDECLVEDGWICGNEPSICVNPISCGNGVVDRNRGEQCDDDNERNGDGCSSNCLVEDGWVCDDGLPSECFEVDGDGGVIEDAYSLTGGGCDCRESEPASLAWIVLGGFALWRRRRFC